MRKNIIIGALLLCSALPVFSQTVVCDTLICSLEPISKIASLADFKYHLQMKMYLSVTDLKSDTLKLETTSNMPFSAFAPKNIGAYLLDKDDPDEAWDIPAFISNQQTLNVVLSKDRPDSLRLILFYHTVGSGLFSYFPRQNYPSVFCFTGEQEFFYPKDIPIRALRVLKPDNMLSFEELRNDYKGQSFVNLTFIKKDAFRQRNAVHKGNIAITTFVPDSLACDSAINTKLNKLYTNLEKIEPLITTPKKINVLLLNWRDDKRRVAAGKGFGNLFVCDIKFAPQNLLHETLHLLFANKIDHSSNGGYFVGESIIEWLAAYFSEGLKEINTQVIVAKDEGNLYDIKLNGPQTYHLIYTVGPAILQKIATQVGKDSMAKALIAYLQVTDDNQFRSYDDFIHFMQNQLPKKAVARMDKMVRGQLHELQPQ